MNYKLSLYEKKILSVFAESYPKSAHFKGGQKLRKANWEKIFPGIERSLEKKNMFLAAVDHLTGLKIISVSWKRFREGDELDALYLENPVLLYSALGINSPEIEREKQLLLLKEFNPADDWKVQFKQYIINRIESMENIPIPTSNELQQILSIVSIDQEQASIVPLRALSVQLFNDSKKLESVLPKLDRLSMQACNFKFSKRYGLERLFPETSIKGQFNIIFKDHRIWPVKNDTVTLPVKTLLQIKDIEFQNNNPEVLSIENKESFYMIPLKINKFSAYVYCSGHLNDADRMLLKLLNKHSVNFYHSGDLDPDGLLIFEEIDSILDKKLNPYFMDKNIYDKYSNYGYLLEKHSLKRLEGVRNGNFFELVSIIKNKKIGVEQEIIDYF